MVIRLIARTDWATPWAVILPSTSSSVRRYVNSLAESGTKIGCPLKWLTV